MAAERMADTGLPFSPGIQSMKNGLASLWSRKNIQKMSIKLGRQMMALVMRVTIACAVVGMATQASGQWAEQVLESFLAFSSSGDSPKGSLIQGTDGALYGLASYGGDNGDGTLFRINCDGSGFTVLHSFLWYDDGANPNGGLVQATNGALYGMTMFGGVYSDGTLFTLEPDGSQFTVLHNFGGDASDGSLPVSGSLAQGRDGALYGTTPHGGTNNRGTIFKINLDGGGYNVIHTFAINDGYGLAPDFGVIQASDGLLYGATPQSGTNGLGTIYRLNSDGSGYEIIHTFGASGDAGEGCRIAHWFKGLTEHYMARLGVAEMITKGRCLS